MSASSPAVFIPPSQRRLIFAGLASSTIEYYDFILYGTMASLVFNKLFFPAYDPAAGTLAAFATFAFGFIARPIGSIVLGRLGDRVGRKRTLMLSLVLMGVATVGVGLLPTYGTIGVAAPVLLIVLRFLQGFALGGEWAGAALVLVEHARPDRKNLMGSVVQMGSLGLVLSTFVTAMTSQLTGTAFMEWGWRIPFLLSTVMFLLTFWIRRRINDSPEYTESKARATKADQPGLIATLKAYWKPILLATGVTGAGSVVYYTISTYGISYATTALGIDRTEVLNALTIAALIYTFVIPLAGWLADKTGARTVLLIGLGSAIVLAFPFFAIFGTGIVGIFFGLTVYLSLAHAFIQAPQATVYSDHFPPLVRYTGLALSQALPTTLIAGTAPFVAQYLLGATGSNTAVCAYIIALSVIAVFCALALTRRKTGQPEAPVQESESGSLSPRPHHGAA